MKGVLAVTNAISRNSTVLAAEGQVSSNLGEEVAILDLKAGTYYGLDAVGTRVWELIQEPRRVSEVRDTIMEEYEVEPDSCERDVITLLQKLADEGLVEVLNESDA
jgi:hypothetical protein